MKPTPVHRFYFSQDEVIAALFPSGIPSKATELRIDGDELVVDFVNPVGAEQAPARQTKEPSTADDDFPGDRSVVRRDEDGVADSRTADSPGKIGPNEQEARALCAERGFQTFLEVKTDEAALRILLHKCGAGNISEIDTNKYKKSHFRDLVGEYQVWLRG